MKEDTQLYTEYGYRGAEELKSARKKIEELENRIKELEKEKNIKKTDGKWKRHTIWLLYTKPL